MTNHPHGGATRGVASANHRGDRVRVYEIVCAPRWSTFWFNHNDHFPAPAQVLPYGPTSYSRPACGALPAFQRDSAIAPVAGGPGGRWAVSGGPLGRAAPYEARPRGREAAFPVRMRGSNRRGHELARVAAGRGLSAMVRALCATAEDADNDNDADDAMLQRSST